MVVWAFSGIAFLSQRFCILQSTCRSLSLVSSIFSCQLDSINIKTEVLNVFQSTSLHYTLLLSDITFTPSTGMPPGGWSTPLPPVPKIPPCDPCAPPPPRLPQWFFQKSTGSLGSPHPVETSAFNPLDPSEGILILKTFFSAFRTLHSSSSSQIMTSGLIFILFFSFLLLNPITSIWSSSGLKLGFSSLFSLYPSLGHYFNFRGFKSPYWWYLHKYHLFTQLHSCCLGSLSLRHLHQIEQDYISTRLPSPKLPSQICSLSGPHMSINGTFMKQFAQTRNQGVIIHTSLSLITHIQSIFKENKSLEIFPNICFLFFTPPAQL